MANVVSLHAERHISDVPATLRRIADEVEAGDLDWPVTTAVLIFGHTSAERDMGDGVLMEEYFHTTYSFGPRTDPFTTRGLVSMALRRWNSGDEE